MCSMWFRQLLFFQNYPGSRRNQWLDLLNIGNDQWIYHVPECLSKRIEDCSSDTWRVRAKDDRFAYTKLSVECGKAAVLFVVLFVLFYNGFIN